VDLTAIDAALTRLEAFDPRQSKLVELRFFGGLTIEETGPCSTSPRHRQARMDAGAGVAAQRARMRGPP